MGHLCIGLSHSAPYSFWSGLGFLCALPRGPERWPPLCCLGVSHSSVAACITESALPRACEDPAWTAVLLPPGLAPLVSEPNGRAGGCLLPNSIPSNQ